MAESLPSLSDVIYDHVCTPCEDDGRNSEARYFCQKCAKQFCEWCLKFHDRVLKNHTVLGIEYVNKWGAIKRDSAVGTCEKHTDKDLELYCADHDELVCTICISVNHRACKTILHLPDAAKGIQEHPDFKNVPKRSRKVQSKLQDITEDKTDSRVILKDSRKDIRLMVKSIRKLFNQMLDYIEEQTLEDLDTAYATLDGEIHYDLKRCSDMIGVVNNIDEGPHYKHTYDDTAAYVGYRNDRENLNDAEVIVHEIKHQSSRLVFKPDSDVTDLLSNLKSFGKTIIERYNDKADHQYKMKSCQTYNVKVAGDTETCKIQSCCQLPDGSLVVVDVRNKKLKRLDEKFDVAGHLTPAFKPLFICYIANYEVAVCGRRDTDDKREITFIDTKNGGWKVTRNFTLYHICTGIAYYSNQLFICSTTSIFAYTLTGQFLHTLYEDKSGPSTVVCPLCSSDKMFISDISNTSINMIDNNGQLLQTFSDHELQDAGAKCLDDKGNMFVCDFQSNAVLQVGVEGQNKMSTVAHADDGVYKPTSIFFDRYTSQLFVGQWSDEILVMEMI